MQYGFHFSINVLFRNKWQLISGVNKNNEKYTVHGDLLNLFCGEGYKSVVRAIKTFQKYRQLCNNFECI